MADKSPSSIQKRGCFKDARGRVVTLLDPYAMHLLRRHDAIPEEVLGELAAEIGSGWPRRQRIAWILANGLPLVVIVATAVVHWSKGAVVGSSDRNIAVVLLASYALGACIVWWWARRNRLQRVCRTMLEYLRCPHCGYDIRGLPTAPEDGATICPECGYAWRLGQTETAGDRGDG